MFSSLCFSIPISPDWFLSYLSGYPIMVEDENSSGIILLIPNRTNSDEDGAGFAVSDLSERSSEWLA
jgi:hypothetical protein